MNAANMPPASVLRPELRARLERLEHLERRERQSRYARWHVPAPTEREPEGWLLTYLDLITLLLVMLVVMLALSQPKTPVAEEAAMAPAVQAAPPAPAHADMPAAAAHSPSSTVSDAPRVMSAATPESAASASASLPVPLVAPDEPAVTLSTPDEVAAQEIPGDQAQATLGEQREGDPAWQTAGMADRPAPVDVALVGSVRSSPSLQVALPFSFDLEGVSLDPVPDTMPDAPFEGATTALSAEAMQNPTPSQATSPPIPPAPAEAPDRIVEPIATPPASLEDLGLNGLGDNIDVIINEESVSFRINNEILFTSGQADLMPSGLEVLTRLAGVLARNDYQIAVEGHTDPVPIQNDRFPSNWELSTGRATSVLRHLHSQGIPASRLRATGYADTKPIAPNDSPAGRAFNRRVELIMEMPRNARKTSQSSSSTSAEGALSLLSGSEFAGPIVRLR